MEDNKKEQTVFRGKDHSPVLTKGQLRDEVDRLLNNELVLKYQLRIARAAIETLEEERDLSKEQMVIDGLTKVRNRKGFDLAFEHGVSQLPIAGDSRKAVSESLGLLVIDVDNFKLVNDQYGHETGDAVLVAIARVIKSKVRASDQSCRWGGDEFAVILPGINTLGLEEVGEKIRSAVTDLDFIEIPNLHISVTIGGAVQLHQSDQQLLFRADKVLFKAKEKGRNRVMITSEV